MCIFTQPVTSVNNTQIFARRSGNGTQFLAYQMSYESQEPNAMILPLPVKKPANDQTLNFIDLKNYDAFFDKLADGFPFHSPPSIGCSSPSGNAITCDSLAVFKVGNYIASFVPTLTDFDRLDSKFTLPAEIWANILGYEDFGFAVFQLAAGSLKPHPMAFEFQPRTTKYSFRPSTSMMAKFTRRRNSTTCCMCNMLAWTVECMATRIPMSKTNRRGKFAPSIWHPISVTSANSWD